MAAPNIIVVDNVSKSYGGIKALKNVNLNVAKGEIHSICGENGAGKSTLLKILSGIIERDSGQLHINGVSIDRASPHLSQNLGVNIVYQEFSLVDELSIAENIYLSSIKDYVSLGWVHTKRLYAECRKLLQALNLDFKPQTLVKNLSISEKQLIEIAKALSRESKILILDEPTGVLSQVESEILFNTLRGLKARGVTIIYVSHRLDEVMELSDTISVFKDGESVITAPAASFSKDALIAHMLGDKTSSYTEKKKAGVKKIQDYKKKKILLEVKDVHSQTGVNGANFVLYEGEVLGIAGIIGAGRTELSRVLFGVDKKTSGSVSVDGAPLHIKNVKDAVRHGFALVPESRKDNGCVISMSVLENIVLPQQKSFVSGKFFLRRKKELLLANKMIKNLAIKASAADAVNSLSGGNQQKVILARWMALNPKILILDEPTRGIDVGSKQEVYHLIAQYISQGGTVILISSELSEILELSDRVYVMNRGKFSPPLAGEEITESRVGNYFVV